MTVLKKMFGTVIETMKNIFCLFLVTTALAWGRFAEAQQTKKLARIGVLSQSSANFMCRHNSKHSGKVCVRSDMWRDKT